MIGKEIEFEHKGTTEIGTILDKIKAYGGYIPYAIDNYVVELHDGEQTIVIIRPTDIKKIVK
jgi:predicted HAD superfamily phosphohydrolase